MSTSHTEKTREIILATTPKFIAQSYRMPRHIQNGLNKFIEEFPNDPYAPTWDLKSISTFKDQNLRSARVNDTYRLVLRIPFEGDRTWYLIWVDNHDEARDWAKNRMVSWNATVQAVQIYDVEEVEGKVLENEQIAPEKEIGEKHPLSTVSDEELERIGVPPVLVPAVRTLRDFFDVDRIQEYIPEGVYENLLHLFAGDPIENIIRDVEDGLVRKEDFAAQKQSANNRRGIVELSGDPDLDRALLGDFAAWRVFLHPSQRRLAEGDFSGPTKVSGGAGTGKTVAALHRAHHLSHHGDGMILFTTFTKSLTNSLEGDLNDMGAKMSRVRVHNLDSLAVQLAKKLKVIPSQIGFVEWANKTDIGLGIMENLIFDAGLSDTFSPEFVMQEYTDVILNHDCRSEEQYRHVIRTGMERQLGRAQRARIWALATDYENQLRGTGYCHVGRAYNDLAEYLRSHPEKAPFRHIVADEIQDLGMVPLRVLRALVPEGRNDLFLAGDPLQKIYPGRTNFSKVGIHIRGKRSRSLKINYRTTEQIRRYALQPIAGYEFLDFDGRPAPHDDSISLRTGVAPEYRLFESREAEIAWLIEHLKSYMNQEGSDHIHPSEIAIAAPKNAHMNALTSKLYAADIPYYQTSNSGTGSLNGVQLSTMHNLKGHEYKVVFLTGLSTDTWPGAPIGSMTWSEAKKAEFRKQQAALLYVACSRAVSRLHLSGVGEEIGLPGDSH